MNRTTCLLLGAALLATLAGRGASATEILFENVGLPMNRELDGLQSVTNYGDYVDGESAGGFLNSFARGNGWTPNIAIDFSAGPDLKTVSSWRDKWDGRDGANYLLDGDLGQPFYYWYTFTPRGGAGVVVNSLDLEGAGDHKNRIDWTIYAGTKVGKMLAGGSTRDFSGDKVKLDLGMSEPYYGVVVLELIHTGTRTSLAVDNLNFDEAPKHDAPQLVNVGNRKQLFVDDFVIAEMSNLTRELGQVSKLNDGKPLLVRDQPWEKTCTFYGTALHDGDKFQMWYRTGGEHGPLAYAESKDGVKWDEKTKRTCIIPA